MQACDIIVIGAGAAGLTAAIFASGLSEKRLHPSPPRVILLERTPQPGRKILMSGGTRCNLLPSRAGLADFCTDSNPRRLLNILKSWSVERCHRWFEYEIGLKMSYEAESEKWFPLSNSAREVRDRMVRCAEKNGVELIPNASVKHMERHENVWRIDTHSTGIFQSPVVIMAMGGSSVPTCGTDGSGYLLAQKLGHRIHPVFPALTPLKGPHPGKESLAGISLDVTLTLPKRSIHSFQAKRNGFLFTHQGYSGPAILDISDYAVRLLENHKSVFIHVNWIGKSTEWWTHKLHGKQTILSLLKTHLPKRLASSLLHEMKLQDKKTAELSKAERTILLQNLTDFPLNITGHFGFQKAEVTGGGVSLEEIDTASMASRIKPGLFFCGEILDVFGRIGGFNFYWAWVTGRLAGLSAIQQWEQTFRNI